MRAEPLLGPLGPVRRGWLLRYLPDSWSLTVVLSALLLALPVITVFSFVLAPLGETWSHLVDTVLAEYISNSLLLAAGVAVGTLTMGVTSAWLTTVCEFPGRRLFQWAMLLPLAFPAYIIAYTYTGLLDFAGPIQGMLRESFGLASGQNWFPEVRSLGGAVVMLSLVLYPYVYLLARAAFLEQSVTMMEASRMLGCGPWRGFFSVALPVARPAITAGVTLALMETLADYGTVEYFGVPTFTTGIFRTWFGLGDSTAAAQLAALLMSFVFVLMVLERWSRRRARFYQVGQRSRSLQRIGLSRWRGRLAFVACLLPLLFGFLVPAAQLSHWAWITAADSVDADFLTLVWHSVTLAAASALVALWVALWLAYGRRIIASNAIKFSVHVAGMGYAVPGTVIAIGVMLPFAWVDRNIDEWLRANFDVSSGLLLSGTVFALIFAYLVRFLAVSLQTVEAGLAQVKVHMDQAARSLGYRPLQVLRRVHIPMMRGSLLTAVLIVFVEVLKELPATLILRPFNFNTLAVRAFELASDERLADSATAALAIVATGLIPIVLLSRSISRSRGLD